MSYYYAKLGNSYINILSLKTSTPNRLKNTNKDRDAICYTENEAIILMRLYPNIQLEIFKLYKRQSYATRNYGKNQ